MLATTPLLKEGRYSIEQELSDLETGARFQAFDTVAETAVTIVEVPLGLPKVATSSQREAIQTSFAAQADALMSVSYKSVLAIRDRFSEGGRNFVVTDLVDGLDLAAMIEDRNTSFSVSQVVEWADELLEALNFLHVAKPPILYKGMRPENVIVRSDRSVAMQMSAAVLGGERISVSATNDSVAYAPLEQLWTGLDAASQKVIINKYDESSERILKQDLDARSDIYSLGATLYHLLTGRRPVDVLERSIEIIEGNVDPLQSPNASDPAIPQEVSNVIIKAMEIKREYRFDSAAIMRQVLKTALVRVREREADSSADSTEKPSQIIVRAVSTPMVNEAVNVQPEVKTAPTTVRKESTLAGLSAIKSNDLAEAIPNPVTESFTLQEFDDDLLGLLSPTLQDSESPNLGPGSPANVVNQPIFKNSQSRSDGESTNSERSESNDDANCETEAVTLAKANRQENIDNDLEKNKKVNTEIDSSPVLQFSPDPFDDTPARGGFPIPAFAVAAGVMLVIAFGGWYFLNPSPQPATTPTETEVVAPPTSQPGEPVKTSYQADSQATTLPKADLETLPTTSPVEITSETERPRIATSSPTQPKPKKQPLTPPKGQPQKKPVTVDDLINDN